MTAFEEWLSDHAEETDVGYADHQQVRHEAIRRFSFAILSRAAIDALLPHGPFLEVGAGSGYWAFELAQAGADIIATDPLPYSDCGVTPRRIWAPVEPLEADAAIRKHGAGRALLMSWPSLNLAWPSLALRQFKEAGGQKLIYVGETEDKSCTGDRAFHTVLSRDWQPAGTITIPRWVGVRDAIQVYEVRRE